MGLARVERQYLDMVAIWFDTLAFTYVARDGSISDQAARIMTRVCRAKA